MELTAGSATPPVVHHDAFFDETVSPAIFLVRPLDLYMPHYGSIDPVGAFSTNQSIRGLWVRAPASRPEPVEGKTGEQFSP